MSKIAEGQIIKQISTHMAVKAGNAIRIYTTGIDIPIGYEYPDGSVEEKGFVIAPEYLYSIPVEDEEDLFAIFDRYEEDNRINLAEIKAATL